MSAQAWSSSLRIHSKLELSLDVISFITEKEDRFDIRLDATFGLVSSSVLRREEILSLNRVKAARYGFIRAFLEKTRTLTAYEGYVFPLDNLS